MNVFVFLFVMGNLTGAFLTLSLTTLHTSYRRYKLYQQLKAASEELQKSFRSGSDQLEKNAKDLQMLGSIKYRLKQVADLEEKQQQLYSDHSLPSKNSLHSRFKNKMSDQLKGLQDQKMTIFQSILDDGMDPNVKFLTENNEEKMAKLSEYMIYMKQLMGKNYKSDPIPDPKTGSSIKSKLRLISNEENKETPTP